MKRWILHIMLVGVLGMLAASCSQDADNPTHGEEGRKVQVTFTLATGGQDAYSRTTWEGYDEDETADVTPVYGGEAFDNKIDPDQLQVWICSENGTPLAKVKRLLHTKESDNTYKFTGTFEATIIESSNYKVMVFANCPEITTLPTSITATTMMKEMPATGNIDAIPMWGVQQISGADLLEEIQDIKIYVLRALAKVEIALSADMISAGEYTLHSASFKKYNKNINCIPNGFASVAATTELGTGTANTTSGTTTTYAGFNPNASSPQEGLSFITITAGQKLVAYVPEYDNNDGKLAMTVNVLKSGESTPTAYDVPFKYSDTAVKDVIRNYYYTYSITEVKEDAPLNLTLTVNPWNLVESELHYKTLGAAKQTITWGEGVKPNADKQIVLDATHSSATFSFELSTPTGATWYATLVPMGGDENAFSFSNTEVVTTKSGAVGQASGTISIHAVNTTGVVEDNNVARLEIIVVTNDGRTINVTDMLGGQYTIMQAKTEE